MSEPNWPSGKNRALGGKSATQALNEALRKTISIEHLKDDDLALGFAGTVIKQMASRGVKRAAGESNRGTNPLLPSDEGHIRVQDKNSRDI